MEVKIIGKVVVQDQSWRNTSKEVELGLYEWNGNWILNFEFGQFNVEAVLDSAERGLGLWLDYGGRVFIEDEQLKRAAEMVKKELGDLTPEPESISLEDQAFIKGVLDLTRGV